jgi:hypothetical protein
MELLIFTKDGSMPRIRYTMEFVFYYVLKIECINFTSEIEHFVRFSGKKLNYSNINFQCECFNISPSGLLSLRDYKKVKIYSETRVSLPYLVYEDHEGIDPFTGIFFMISRYEEYWSFQADVHSRFPAAESMAYQNGFLEFPIVDAWIDWIRKRINETFPNYSPLKKPAYHFMPTYDIDHIRAYLWKGFARSIGGMTKDVLTRNGQLVERIKVLLGKEKDNYDVFGFLDNLHEKYNLSPIYFWLLGDFGAFDKNPSVRHPSFRKEIQKLDNQYDMGIHPSYGSFLKKKQIEKEIHRLKEIISVESIERNRFHFLRFQLPGSYRMLIELGIKADYSMAFPDALGFRAGTSHPFYWYDLKTETTTSLKIYPFQIMDVSLKNYLGLTPDESVQKAKKITSHIKEYGGHFISLWHNSSFDEKEWNGWKEVYEEILKIGSS